MIRDTNVRDTNVRDTSVRDTDIPNSLILGTRIRDAIAQGAKAPITIAWGASGRGAALTSLRH